MSREYTAFAMEKDGRPKLPRRFGIEYKGRKHYSNSLEGLSDHVPQANERDAITTVPAPVIRDGIIIIPLTVSELKEFKRAACATNNYRMCESP